MKSSIVIFEWKGTTEPESDIFLASAWKQKQGWFWKKKKVEQVIRYRLSKVEGYIS